MSELMKGVCGTTVVGGAIACLGCSQMGGDVLLMIEANA